MNKQLTYTGTTGVAQVIELGFVPSSIKLVNRTSLDVFEWNENLAAGYYYLVVGSTGIRTLVNTNDGLTLIDGSDKSAILGTSFGVILDAALATFVTTGEIVDV